jgi:hypothetical protein
MISLNLLPDVKKEFLKSQRARSKVITFAIISTIAVVAGTVVLVLYVYAGQALLLASQTNDIQAKSKTLKNVKDINKYLTVQNQLAELTSLHDNKTVMSRLMSFLPQLNPAAPHEIKLASLDVDTVSQTVTFKGTTDTYDSLTTFKDTLSNARVSYSLSDGGQQSTKNLFTSVQIKTGVYAADQSTGARVVFEVEAVYEPDVFLFKTSSASLQQVNIDTTQSTVNAPNIFSGGGQ